MVAPRLMTSHTTRVRTVTVPSVMTWGRALFTRLIRICRRRSGSARTTIAHLQAQIEARIAW